MKKKRGRSAANGRRCPSTSLRPFARTAMAARGIRGEPVGRMSRNGRVSAPRRVGAFALALVVPLLLTFLFRLEPATAQNLPLISLEATINQNAVMRQELS